MSIYKPKNNNALRWNRHEDDMVGKQFNQWTVLGFSHKDPTSGNWYYDVVCSCGTTSKTSGSILRKNKSKQCKSCAAKINGRKGLYSQGQDTDLYFIRCGEYVKIGVSKDVNRRLKDLQSSNPFPLELIYLGKGEGNDEEFWHKVYEHRHHHGEWYHING